MNCSSNLLMEYQTINPVATIICGKEPLKWCKKFLLIKNEPHIEMSSLSVLFRGKAGINSMRTVLKAIKDTYIG